MSKVYVQFSDAAGTSVVSVFSCPQDAAVVPNQGQIDITDSRYLDFLNPALTPAQEAANAINGGITLTSTGTPALDGVYSMTQADQEHINVCVTSILLNGTFPDGGSTYEWPDSSGALHTFPSVAEFKSFASAAAAFVAGCLKYANGVAGATLPSSAITIA